MKSIFTLFFFFIVAIAFAQEEEVVGVKEQQPAPESTQKVKELTFENFFTTITENDFVLMEFYAKWCGHCKQFVPTYEKIATALEGRVTVARIDADTHSVIASLQEIQSFPTIKLFVKGVPIFYDGVRSFDDVISFVNRGIEPSYTVLNTEEEFDKFVEANPKTMIACFGTNETEIGPLRHIFEDISLQIHVSTDVNFAIYEDAEVIGVPSCPGFVARNPDYETLFVYDIGTYLDVYPEDLPPPPPEEEKEEAKENSEYGTPENMIDGEIIPPGDEDHILHSNNNGEEEEEVKLDNNIEDMVPPEINDDLSDGIKIDSSKDMVPPKRSAQSVIAWLSESMLPLVDEVSGRNFDKYAHINRPMVWLVMREKNDEAMAAFNDAAREFQLMASFVWLNDTMYHVQSKLIGIPEDSAFPTIAITFGRKHYVFTKEMTEEFSFDTICQFVNYYFDQTLEPVVRSGPVPDAEENAKKPFKTIVRSQWDEVVMDPKRDVLVEFYSFWCSNCMNLKGLFEDLGKALGEVETFMFGGIELSENDFPDDIEADSFPYLVFYPAGEEKKPIVYNRDIVLSNMIKFVQENAG